MPSQGVVREYHAVHNDAVTCVAAAGPGLCFSGAKDQTAVIFDFVNGQVKERWNAHEKEITKVTCGCVSQSYFSASRDKTVNMWKVGNSNPVQSFKGHDLVVTGLSLNPENSKLCSGSRDNSIRIWDLETAQCVSQNSVSRNLITDVSWAPSGDLITQTGEDKEVRVWDAKSLQVVHTYPKKQYIQTCCDIDAGSKYLVTSSNGFQGNGCEATLWDLRSKSPVHEFKGHDETVCSCAFLPTSATRGRNLIATSSNDCSVRIWDRDTQECVAIAHVPGSGPLTSIAAFDDGTLCVSSFNTGIHVFKMEFTAQGDIALNKAAQF